MKRIILISTIILLALAMLVIASPAYANPDTYSSQPNESNSQDTYINSGFPTQDYDVSPVVYIGASGGVYRTLIKFDLSSIPTNAVISSATLSLWVKTDYSINARNFCVFRSKVDWEEANATWNKWNYFDTLWETSGGFGANDAEQADIGCAAMTASETDGTEKQWSLSTSAIQEVISGAFVNNGFLIKADTENDDAYGFYSANESTYTERRPKLVIDYTLPTASPTLIATETAIPTLYPTRTPKPTHTPRPTRTPKPTHIPNCHRRHHHCK